jgi:mxaJ protein
MGVPTSYELAQVTAPYYRSSYVFVTRRDRHLRVTSFDSPALRHLRIGVHIIGDDYANSPAADALARRGLRAQVVGYTIYGDYSQPDPPANLLRALEHGDIDVAVAWGPLAGWYAKHAAAPLELVPVSPQVDLPFVPFAFDIGAGVRRGDTLTRNMVEQSLARHRADIARLLDDYGIPRVDLQGAMTMQGGVE